MSKQKKLTDTDNRMMGPWGEAWGWTKRVKGVNYMGTRGNSILSSEHTIAYIDTAYKVVHLRFI